MTRTATTIRPIDLREQNVGIPSETISGGVTKVERYHWRSRNRKGELVYVEKLALQVDPVYQRDLNDRKRLAIAADFNWAAFGAISVVRRKDGSLWVLDGQHRLAGAMARADVKDVPCVIFDLDGELSDEATDFLVANKERRPLTGVETFRAMLTSGDPIAAEVARLAQAIGREIGQAGPKHIACVKAVYKAVQTDPAALRRVWPILDEICRGHSVDNRLLQGLHYVERKLIRDDGTHASLTEPVLRKRLTDGGMAEIMKVIAESSAYYQRGGESVWARGIIKLLNYRCQKKLALEGQTTSE